MATLANMLNQNNLQLFADKAVIERRAEMAAQCECLAAWDARRECICDKTVEMPLSVKQLNAAHDIVRQIETVDGHIAQAQKMAAEDLVCRTGSDDNEHFDHFEQRSGIYFSNGRRAPLIEFEMPRSMLLAALHEQRLRLMVKLSETGIVSAGRPNVKAVPK
jgi:hypothetical protein